MNPTPAQRAAYNEAARAHGIPALVSTLLVMALAAAAFATQLLGGGKSC